MFVVNVGIYFELRRSDILKELYTFRSAGAKHWVGHVSINISPRWGYIQPYKNGFSTS